MKKIIAWITVLLCAHNLATAQENLTLPRRLFILYHSHSSLTEKENLLIYETLIAALQEKTQVLIVEPKEIVEPRATTAAAAGDRDNTTLARENSADAWLAVSVSKTEQTLQASFTLYDMRVDSELWQHTTEVPYLLRYLQRRLWNDLISAVNSTLPVVQTASLPEDWQAEHVIQTIEKARGSYITVKGVPGSRVTGIGKQTFTLDEKGEVTMEAPQSATYKIRIFHPQYYPATQYIYLGEKPEEVVFRQEKGPSFGYEIFSDIGNSTGADLLYYIRPNATYLRGGFNLSFFSLIPSFQVDRHNWEANTLMLTLDVGHYLNSQDSFFRYSVGAGLFVSWFFPEKEIQEDPVFHPVYGVGMQIPLTVEISGALKSRFFIRWLPRIYLQTPRVWNEFLYPDSPYNYLEDNPYRDTIQLVDLIIINLSQFYLGVKFNF